MAEEKSKMVYFLLAWLLGWCGAHKFYIGNAKHAIFYILIYWCTMGLGSILCLITGILALTKSDEEFQQRYVEEQSFI